MSSRCPQNIDKHSWYYEYKHYIVVIHEIYDGDRYLGTDQIRIPKYKLKKSLARMD